MNNYFYYELQEKLLEYQSSIFINYNEFLHLLQTNSKSMTDRTELSGADENFRKSSQVIYPDLNEVAKNFRKSMQLPDLNYSGFAENFRKSSQVIYPDLNEVAENFRKSMQLPDLNYSGFAENFRKSSQVIYPDLNEVAKNFRKSMQLPDLNFSGFAENFRKASQLTYPDMNIILTSIADFQKGIKYKEIKSHEFTQEDLEEANEILESDNPAERVKKEISIKDYIPKPILIIITTLYFLVEFLNNLAGVINFTEEKIPIVMESYEEYIAENNNVSDRESIKWLNDVIKKDTEKQITQNFRIVTKNNLVVREGKKVNSKSQGSLSHGDVVQIIEKKRNWTYIHFSDHEENIVIEGWVFTRYLKQIK